MPIGQVGGSIGLAMAGSDEAALGKGEVRAVGGILGGGYSFGEPALPYWGKVYFDADKRISSINLSFSQKNLQGCAIADEGASLEWDSKQPDVVTIRSYVDLPEYCWGKKVVRPVSKDGEQGE